MAIWAPEALPESSVSRRTGVPQPETASKRFAQMSVWVQLYWSHTAMAFPNGSTAICGNSASPRELFSISTGVPHPVPGANVVGMKGSRRSGKNTKARKPRYEVGRMPRATRRLITEPSLADRPARISRDDAYPDVSGGAGADWAPRAAGRGTGREPK